MLLGLQFCEVRRLTAVFWADSMAATEKARGQCCFEAIQARQASAYRLRELPGHCSATENKQMGGACPLWV